MKKTKEAKLEANHTNLVDEAFTVDRAKWGTFRSYDAEGKALVTSPSEDACVAATRFYLKGLQEGFTKETLNYDGTVGGKL